MATDVVDIQIRDLTELFQSVKDDSKTETAKKEEVLAEAKDLLQQLKVSVHSVSDKTKKTTVQGQIRGFEADVAKLQKAVLMAGASTGGNGATSGDGAAGARSGSMATDRRRRRIRSPSWSSPGASWPRRRAWAPTS